MTDCNSTNGSATNEEAGETWQIVVTLTCVVAMLAGMAYEIAPADMIMMGTVVLMLVVDIISIPEAVQGCLPFPNKEHAPLD